MLLHGLCVWYLIHVSSVCSKSQSNEPSFTDETNELLNKIGNELNYQKPFKAHNLPWVAIKKVLRSRLGDVGDRNVIITNDRYTTILRLIDDIHTIDEEATYFSKLTLFTRSELIKLNEANKKKSRNALDKLVDISKQKVINRSLYGMMLKRLEVLLNSAPANIRPGDSSVNIGHNYDPNTSVYDRRKLTNHSLNMSNIYDSNFDRDSYGEMLTSDEPAVYGMGSVDKRVDCERGGCNKTNEYSRGASGGLSYPPQYSRDNSTRRYIRSNEYQKVT